MIKNGLISKFSAKDINGFSQSSAAEKENYVCNDGTASVVKHFLHDVKNVIFNKRVASMSVTDDGRIQVVPEGQGTSEIFDVVVSTMPVPQLLQLENINNILERLGIVIKLTRNFLKILIHRNTILSSSTGNLNPKQKLMEVSYSSRYALGLFYNEKLSVAPTESSINYVDDNPAIRYWTLEDEKRRLGQTNTSVENSTAAVVHTSTTFGAENIDRNADDIKEILLKCVKDTCKSLQGKEPAFVKCHKWRYSQVNIIK